MLCFIQYGIHFSPCDVFFMRTRPTIIDLLEGVWSVGGDACSPLAPVVGPEQKKKCHPLPLLLMAVSTIASMCYLTSYCMRHPWRTKDAAIKWKPARRVHSAVFESFPLLVDCHKSCEYRQLSLSRLQRPMERQEGSHLVIESQERLFGWLMF